MDRENFNRINNTKVHSPKTHSKKLSMAMRRRIIGTSLIIFTLATSISLHVSAQHREINKINTQTNNIVSQLDDRGKEVLEREIYNIANPLIKSAKLTDENEARGKQIIVEYAAKCYKETSVSPNSSEIRVVVDSAITKAFNSLIARDNRSESYKGNLKQDIFWDDIRTDLDLTKK